MKKTSEMQTTDLSERQSTSADYETKSGAAWLASAPSTKQIEFVRSLSDQELRALPYMFEFWALEHQHAPEGDWRTWLMLGGRGSGKTRAGAEWVRSIVEGSGPRDPGECRRIALVGETYKEARDVMVQGESGIIACSPPDRRPVWVDTKRQLQWPNGAVAQVFSATSFDALRGPQFDGAWLDEIGCAAIDKGTNQPNKFLDPKSSESALPKYSNGARDDLMQMQYIRALSEYWSSPENNPVASHYSGTMVDTSRMFVWAWDARPYPNFPSNLTVWSDGENYAQGHWLSGRVTARSLAAVVAEICEGAGVTEYDVSELHGLVRGYQVSSNETPRSALQPLLMSLGVDAFEVAGLLVFRNRSLRVQGQIGASEVLERDAPGQFTQVRDTPVDIPERVRFNYIEADAEFAARTDESIYPDGDTFKTATTEVPLVLTSGEGALATERWLTEMRVARDRVSFALPPSSSWTAGDVVEIVDPEASGMYRIDRHQSVGDGLVEAVRVEPGIYENAPFTETVASIRASTAALPVWSVLLDIPLLRGDESPEAPWVAATGSPWPGTVAVYASGDGSDWDFSLGLRQRASLGVTETPLAYAKPGIWDRGAALVAKLPGTSLSSTTKMGLLSGANAAVIGNPETQEWEVFQFREADLVGDDTWALSLRLRGQRGTDGLIPSEWPVGSTVLILDTAMEQVSDAAAWRGQSRLYRVGPARKAVDHSSFTTTSFLSRGVGLRPYRPVHISHKSVNDGLELSWIRQTRVDGDLWQETDVPLGEAVERYRVRVLQGATVLRVADVSDPTWTYSHADKLSDGVVEPYSIEIAQVSDRFGPGLYGKVTIDE